MKAAEEGRQGIGPRKNQITVRCFIENRDQKIESPLLNLQEIALYLNLKPSKIRSMVFRKELPYLKLGRLVRFHRQQIDAWILEHCAGSKAGHYAKTGSTIFEIDTRFNRARSERRES